MTLADIKKDCQENLKQIVERSLDLGINHFETARGYGKLLCDLYCSFVFKIIIL